MDSMRLSPLARPESPRPRLVEAWRLLPVGTLLGLFIGAAWTYLVYMDWGMRHMDVGMDMWIMPQMVDWDVTDFSLVVLMWAVMMAAMMLPSVLPVIVVLIRIGGSAHAAGFIAGYLMAWGGFSVGATLLHWALLKAALVSPMMESVSVPLSATVLATAGLFQFTPLKHTCLTRCRSPWGAVLNPSRATIAMHEGLRHAAFCVGCCWALMALLFVAGVMNLIWIAVISAYVIAEKWAPGAEWFSRAVGALLCLAAVVMFGVGAS
jgi:predicted metal-binding membrane protein